MKKIPLSMYGISNSIIVFGLLAMAKYPLVKKERARVRGSILLQMPDVPWVVHLTTNIGDGSYFFLGLLEDFFNRRLSFSPHIVMTNTLLCGHFHISQFYLVFGCGLLPLAVEVAYLDDAVDAVSGGTNIGRDDSDEKRSFFGGHGSNLS